MSLQKKNISRFDFEKCLKCTICTTVCPVATVNPKYPGPKQAGPDMERLRLKDGRFFESSLKMCLGCRRCEVACPSGVSVADLIQEAKFRHGHNFSVRNLMLSATDLVGSTATMAAGTVNKLMAFPKTKKLMDSTLNIDKRRQFPAYTDERFETWYKRCGKEQQTEFSRQIAYYHGCYVNYNYPQLGKDLIKVMNALGYGVQLIRGEKCCGTPMIANGFKALARGQAVENIRAISAVVNKGVDVIATSSSCAYTLRDEYPHLLGINNAAVRNHIQLATRFIHTLLTETDATLPLDAQLPPLKIAYHTPCHLQRMGWGLYTTELMKMIPGVELTVLGTNCCGIAGTYGFKKENYAVSQAIGEPLFEEIERSGCDFVVTDCETCKWQIEMSTGKQVLHPISLIALRLRQ